MNTDAKPYTPADLQRETVDLPDVFRARFHATVTRLAELTATQLEVSALQSALATETEKHLETVKERDEALESKRLGWERNAETDRDCEQALKERDEFATRFNVEELADLACVDIGLSEELGKAWAALDAVDKLAFSNRLADSFELARNFGRETSASLPSGPRVVR